MRNERKLPAIWPQGQFSQFSGFQGHCGQMSELSGKCEHDARSGWPNFVQRDFTHLLWRIPLELKIWSHTCAYFRILQL